MVALIAIVYFIAAGGFCFLQIFFSKRASAVPGLILPIVSLLFSLVIASGALYTVTPMNQTTEEMEDEKYHITYFVEADVVEVTYAETGNPVDIYFVNDKIYDAATKEEITLADAYDFTNTSIAESVRVNANIGTILLVMFIVNIPTIAYLIIYAVCREKKKNNLERMIAQDL